MQSKITEHFEPMSKDKPLAPPLARIRDYTAPLNVKPHLSTEWNGEPSEPRRPPPSVPKPARPKVRRQLTPADRLWHPERYPFERVNSAPTFEPKHEHVKVVRRATDASPPILPASFDKHKARHNHATDLEAGRAIVGASASRVVPFLGQLPDNWQLGVVIGIAIGLVFQLIQTGVNSSLKTGQSEILSRLPS